MKKQILFLSLIASTKAVFSQTDSLLFSSVYEGKTANSIDALIYNGREHIRYLPMIEGTAYYLSSAWQTGSLVFEGVLYKDVAMQYDLVADELVVRHLNGVTGIVLFTERIQSFNLGDKKFVYLHTGAESMLKPGIYEELVKGQLSLYAKRSKFIEQNIVFNVLEQKFIDNNGLYLLKDDKYYPVKKQKEIFALIADNKREVTAFMKRSKIKYKSNPELAAIKIVEYYNQISR